MLGHEAMKKMGLSNVFISGMKGLGVEVGKHELFSFLLKPSNINSSKNSAVLFYLIFV